MSNVQVVVETIPEDHDTPQWRYVVALETSGAHWPLAVCSSPGRADLVSTALEMLVQSEQGAVLDDMREILRSEQGS